VYKPGAQVLTFFSEVDDSDQPYAIYLPKSLDRTKRYPLVISLHGAWSNHRLNLRRVFGRGNLFGETDSEATRYFPPMRDVPFIVASPFARGTMGYRGIAEKDVYDVLADVKQRFPIDDDRVYLTGLSMGGGGTLWLGLTRPDVWAALAAVCPAPPEGTDDLAGNALGMPVKLFQGDADPVVSAADTRAWHKRLENAGAAVEYVEYPGVRHNSWERAYRDGAIFDWFAEHKRNRWPANVRFATREYTYRSAYWVAIDAMTPGRLASIDARFRGANAISVSTDSLDGFTLTLAGHPSWSRGRPLLILIDDKQLKVASSDNVSFTRTRTGWVQGKYKFAAAEKRPGAAGPISEAISGRHLYVYGTAGAITDDEVRFRRDQAQRAADWSASGNRLLLNFRAVADRDVAESDLRSSNLVLFGNRETNTLIARIAPQLPAELKPGAADFGLIMVVPFGDRLAVVNSGLPWWTRADQARRSGLSFIPVPFRALESFGDFILFKGGLDDVIAEGRFDRHWRLPAEAAARMTATGAVTVRRP
jgi:pimeloyl-ACP methyl ester carboxylesterase